MNDDPAQVKILFAQVESVDDILQTLADEIYDFFLRDGKTTVPGIAHRIQSA